MEIVPKTRKIGIANLTYEQIGKVFQYLDAKLILALYRASSEKNENENDKESNPFDLK